LIPISQDLFRSESDERQFTFRWGEAGERPHIRVITRPWEEISYEPVDEFNPGMADLVAYAGEYHSREAEVTLVVTVEGGELVVHRRPFSRFALGPLYPDVFRLSPGFIVDERGDAALPPLIQFHRDGIGRVQELSIRQPGTFDVRFGREVR